MKLPVAIARAAETAPAAARTRAADRGGAGLDLAPSLRGLRVLVVDDDRDGLELVATILIDTRGPRCGPRRRRPRGSRALRAWRPDVLISDIEMPGEDGYTFIRRVRALEPAGASPAPRPSPSPPTAGSRTACARSSAGFSMHVPKPVDPAELAMVVASLAGRT